jgi:hypothetical protein
LLHPSVGQLAGGFVVGFTVLPGFPAAQRGTQSEEDRADEESGSDYCEP